MPPAIQGGGRLVDERKIESISIIIVNWNSGYLLDECFRHLSRQTIHPEHIYVMDNDSTDESCNLKNIPDFVKVIKLPANIGFAAGNNRALSECKSDFVALLNPDAFPASDWIEQMLKAAQRHPNTVAFGSRQLCYEDANLIDGIGDSYHISGLVWRGRHGLKQKPEDLIEREIFSPCAAAAMYRREAIEEVGGFDEDFFCYVEDVDLGFRLRLAGYKAIYVPDAVVQHVGSATTGGQHSDFAVYHGHRNIVWTYFKNMPGILFWLFLPLHISLNILTIIVFAFRRQFRVILQSKRDAVKGIAKVWRKRRKIQTKRNATCQTISIALNKQLISGKKKSRRR